jgi:hypothetical protein
MGLIFLTLLLAADPSQWSAIRELKHGDRVGVIQTDMKRIEGRFDSATDDAITVDGVSVPKDRVVRVYRRPKLNRVARIVIGGALGAAAGGVVDGTFGTYLRNEAHGPGAGAITAISAGVGAAIGAGTGGSNHTIYRK